MLLCHQKYEHVHMVINFKPVQINYSYLYDNYP